MNNFSLAFVACALLWPAIPAHAESAPAPAPSPACVEVEVNGVRSQSFACLTEKLQPASGAQQAKPSSPMTSEQIINQPGNQLGVFNRAALSNRMGNTLGTSVIPQRPPASAR
ncbi:hypothetical protein [Herbaspirillum sp. alder98]|uniref:hypothetical protein n=1 Tax=Herbaspirillum sp. alder98 TaxID=2913096 RepID=UPI001CD8AFBA|nr:hypothetical protein [Herbaspirillum sp. alder98]MCA1325587.1 hypothetical protein [Herbaspirillum sp. alder98]